MTTIDPFVPGGGAPGAGASSGTGYTPTYTPQPYGQTYGGEGLVYGLGQQSAPQPGRYRALPVFDSRNNFFGKVSTYFPGSGGSATELDRAAAWIHSTLANDAEREKWQGYVKQFFPNGSSWEGERGLWAAAAQYASETNKLDPNARWSPWDALDEMWKRYQKSGGAGGGGGGGVSTNSSTNIQQTSLEDAGPTLDQALTSLLGRTASDSEKKKFLSVLNAKERANPSTSTSTTRSDGSGNSTTTGSSVSRGVNPQSVALNWATEQEGFAEYQMATTYLDAMLDALSSPV